MFIPNSEQAAAISKFWAATGFITNGYRENTSDGATVGSSSKIWGFS